MKNKFIRIILSVVFLQICVLGSAQNIELVKVFKEFPDSLFKLKENGMYHCFTQDIRAFVLDNKNFNTEKNKFIVSGDVVSKELYAVEVPEYAEVFYEIEIDKNQNYIHCEHLDADLIVSIDFIVISEGITYKVMILEQYHPGMGNPDFIFVNEYTFDKNSSTYIDNYIPFPSFQWTDFYSKKSVKSLNMDYLDGVGLPYFVNITVLSGQLYMEVLPDFETLTNLFVGSMDHEFESERNYGEDYELTFKALGFDDLPDAKPVFVSIINFTKIEK